jgi:hypothetical protein
LPNSGTPDSTDTRLVLIPRQNYTLTCKINDTQNEGEFTIESQAGEKRSVKLNPVAGHWGSSIDDQFQKN